jgi:probable rRNA maturation factor
MIYYRNDVRNAEINVRVLKATAQKLLNASNEKDSSLSLTLVDDRTIRNLNREHRGKDTSTDVLSFPLVDATHRGSPSTARLRRSAQDGSAAVPMNMERMLGDVVISVDTAKRQATGYDASLQDEVHRLLIHGVLHILGHDHEKIRERARMEAEERRLAEAIGMKWPYDV